MLTHEDMRTQILNFDLSEEQDGGKILLRIYGHKKY